MDNTPSFLSSFLEVVKVHTLDALVVLLKVETTSLISKNVVHLTIKWRVLKIWRRQMMTSCVCVQEILICIFLCLHKTQFHQDKNLIFHILKSNTTTTIITIIILHSVMKGKT